MPEYRIAIEPRNPGQFFACCGLFEIANRLVPGGLAQFKDGGREFCLVTDACLPPRSIRLAEHLGAPVDATLEPLELIFDERLIALDWWLDEAHVAKSALKTWGGQQTPRGVLTELLSLLDHESPYGKLFESAAFTKSRFGVDSTSAWEALDAGYSPNDESQSARTFPWVEVLAVVGLQTFRPARINRSKFCYAAWLESCSIPVARAAAAGVDCAISAMCFEFLVATRGQGYKTFLSAKEVSK
jgi:CRISPR-associated protein Csx14